VGTSCAATKHQHIIDAAECATSLAVTNGNFLKRSQIPLVVHQTWKTASTDDWSVLIRECIGRWLAFATGHDVTEPDEMAWFLWDDDGVEALVSTYESDLKPLFEMLPYPVEKSDVFRVLVLKWFGGVYGDIDSQPLQHPNSWIHADELLDWGSWGSNTSTTHALHTSAYPAYTVPRNAPANYTVHAGLTDTLSLRRTPAVTAIYGIEADNPPEPDTAYWRMGYSYPVQVTNWAFAMAPHHHSAEQYLLNLQSFVSSTQGKSLKAIDPLDITGPPAITKALQDIALEDNPSFDWQTLSGRNGDPPGGIGKIIAGDTLILPITGFNPGRGWLHNMGSRSFGDPNARLKHAAAGSWRAPDLKVHYGKFCRTVLGMCRDWKKIPDVKD